MNLSEDEFSRCNAFYGEMVLDGRINALRETYFFKGWVPEEKSHTICLWLKDDMGGYYSPGKITVDDTYIISNGIEHVLTQFKHSFINEGSRVFEYIFDDKTDSEMFGIFLILLRNTLTFKGYRATQYFDRDPSIIHIIDKRLV